MKAKEINELCKQWNRLVKQYGGAMDISTEVQMRSIERKLPERINLKENNLIYHERWNSGKTPDEQIVRRTTDGNIDIYSCLEWCRKNDVVCFFEDAR